MSEHRNKRFRTHPYTLMKNKVIQIISAFLLASMVVPIIVEGVELARDHSAAEVSPISDSAARHDLLYPDTAALHAYDSLPHAQHYAAPLPKLEMPTMPQL